MGNYRVTGTIVVYVNGHQAKETHRIRQTIAAGDGAEAMRQAKAGYERICEADLAAEPVSRKATC